MSPTSVAGTGGDKGLSGTRTRCGPSSLPPGHLANRPSGLPWRQVTGPEAPGRAGSGAMGRATMRTARFQGLDPTDSGRDPGLAGFARPWLYLCVVDYRGPARPPSGSCSSAALMEQQPEPLASAAPAATGPAQATAATPLTTAAPTPPTTETRGPLGGSAAALKAPRAHCAQEAAHWSAELLLSVKAGTLRKTIGYF